MGDIPLALPPPVGIPRLGAMREPRFTMPIPVNRGKEVAFENLVPGKEYYLQRDERGPMDEILFVEGNPNHQFRARFLPRLMQFTNHEGNPTPVYEARAPGPMRNAIHEVHAWPHYRFFEINQIKRRGRFLAPAIAPHAKRQAIVNSMARRGLPSAIGTGPVNTILNYAGLRPPRGTRGGKRRGNKKTRKQYGGALQNPRRVRRNVVQGSQIGEPPAGEEATKPLGSSNLYYAIKDEDITQGYALIIGPRSYMGGRFQTSLDREVARYPFEECLFLFSISLPDDYPHQPPRFLHQTPGILGTPNYRIHPNLYEANEYSDSRKTCLGILNTYGEPEWRETETITSVLEKMATILYNDPGTFEPMTGSLYESVLSSGRINREGVLYNQHSFAEALEYTCAIYTAVIRAVNDINHRYTFDSPAISMEMLAQAGLPPILLPFANALIRRAYGALTFLTTKVDSFLIYNRDPTNPLSGQIYLEADRMRHKRERTVDFEELKTCLQDALDSIPEGLRTDIIKPSLLDAMRAAYARNHREGETLAQFSQRMSQRPAVVPNIVENQRNNLVSEPPFIILDNESNINQYNLE